MRTDELVTLLGATAEKTGLDWALRLEIAHECGWSIEVRITPHPNADGADVSTVFFLGGVISPEKCAAQITPDLTRFLAGLSRGPRMSTPVVTIFVRHSPGRNYAGDELNKTCRCRKHLRWSKDGKQSRRKAGTRSWAMRRALE